MKEYTEQNQWILLIFLIISIENISAQQLTPYVVSSSGGFYSNASGMLSFTTAEMTAVETFISPLNILTQGFQQTDELGTYTIEHPDSQFSFAIYPNPSDGNFNLVTEAEVNEHIGVKILDVMGRQILQTTFYEEDKINIKPFDLSAVAAGIYLVSLFVKENNSSKQENYFIKIIQIVK